MASQVVQKRMNQGIQPLESKTTKTLISHKRLEGKVAIVTGGAKGIGEETVKLFVQHGAKVVIADIDDTAGQALANSLAPSVTFTHCDVTSENDIQNLITSTVSKHGHLDILFNNAGLLGSQTRNKMSIVDFDVEELNRLMSVNLRGMALGMKHAARVMIPQGHGCIISAASIAGIMGGLGSHAYTASKHAIIGLMKNVSGELGKYGIRVNCISPYGVVTQMTVNAWKEALDHEEGLMDESDQSSSNASSISGEMVEQMEMFMSSMGNLKGATLKAKDIAEAALYLASDESKYVSGHNLVVDGGITASKILSAL